MKVTIQIGLDITKKPADWCLLASQRSKCLPTNSSLPDFKELFSEFENHILCTSYLTLDAMGFVLVISMCLWNEGNALIGWLLLNQFQFQFHDRFMPKEENLHYSIAVPNLLNKRYHSIKIWYYWRSCRLIPACFQALEMYDNQQLTAGLFQYFLLNLKITFMTLLI